MHAIEKILARAAGKATVTTGEIVNCKVDMAGRGCGYFFRLFKQPNPNFADIATDSSPRAIS